MIDSVLEGACLCGAVRYRIAAAPPVEHIWCESRIPWFDTADSLPRRQQEKRGR